MKGRVLIIDDEAEIRRNLTVGLTQEGYSVVACPDGISAIHELNAAREKGIAYDYLVTDIFMPDIDGLKILKVIKSQYPDLPVLVITGFGDEALKFTALSELNTGYLDKPFEIPDLVKALEELSPGSTAATGGGEGKAEPEMRESVSAYLTIRITDPSGAWTSSRGSTRWRASSAATRSAATSTSSSSRRRPRRRRSRSSRTGSPRWTASRSPPSRPSSGRSSTAT